MTVGPENEINLSEDEPEARTPDGVIYRFTYEILDEPDHKQPGGSDRSRR